MRLIFFLAFIIILLPESYSQSKFNIGGSFNVGIPVGDLSDIAKTGIGGSVNSEYRFGDKISATFAVYYYSYPSKVPTIAVGGSTYDFRIDAIPVIAGARYYLNDSFFGTVEAGAHFSRVSADVYLGDNLSTDYKAKYGIGVGGGYRIRLAEPSVFEITAVYQYVEDNLSSISLRATILILTGNL
jgi:hypothetical protein